jgi:hypothetical protein
LTKVKESYQKYNRRLSKIYQMDTEKLLNIEKTAELLEVTVPTVRKAISEGRLKAFKRFSKWYIFVSDVFDFIRSGECSLDTQSKPVK